MSRSSMTRDFLKFTKLSRPRAKQHTSREPETLREARHVFHRFSFGSISIKTNSDKSLEQLLELAREELRACQRRAS